MQAASCAVYAGIRIPKRRICESVHGSVRNAVHTMTGMSMLQSISGMRICVLCTACSDRNIEKTVGHTGIARLCLTQWCHRTRTDGSLFAKGSPRLCRRGRMSVRPARTLFLKVKVLSAPVSGKHIANKARVSAVKRNLKEACGKPLVRRTEIAYEARLREISWRKTAKSNNYHICRSRVNAADL